MSVKGNLEQPAIASANANNVVSIDNGKKVSKEMKKSSAHDLKLRAQDICKLDLSNIRKILKEYMNLAEELSSTIRGKDKLIRTQRKVIETQSKIIEKLKPGVIKQ
jgi:sensor histidine kinase YesM